MPSGRKIFRHRGFGQVLLEPSVTRGVEGDDADVGPVALVAAPRVRQVAEPDERACEYGFESSWGQRSSTSLGPVGRRPRPRPGPGGRASASSRTRAGATAGRSRSRRSPTGPRSPAGRTRGRTARPPRGPGRGPSRGGRPRTAGRASRSTPGTTSPAPRHSTSESASSNPARRTRSSTIQPAALRLGLGARARPPRASRWPSSRRDRPPPP